MERQLNMFDLQRLEKKARLFKFAGVEGKEITITAHYPTPHEIAAALSDAGADLNKALELSKGEETGLESLELSAKMGGALEELACYCIDACSEIEFKKVKSKHLLRRISDEVAEQLSPVLSIIGAELYKGSEVSKEEGEG